MNKEKIQHCKDEIAINGIALLHLDKSKVSDLGNIKSLKNSIKYYKHKLRQLESK
jgi:hypothetical protein